MEHHSDAKQDMKLMTKAMRKGGVLAKKKGPSKGMSPMKRK